ncbi:MAG: phosphoglucomutase/phosphomannomutase family protein, partial [Actinomycetota bacterium]|nr:phosphoglucomutase/phosphomannomutase family protein [Actinomycetota bacterium]
IREVEKNPPPRPDVFFEDILEPGKVEFFDPLPDYLDKVVSMVDKSAFSKWNMKVLFDPMYGAGQGVFPEAALALGLSCDEIHNVHNPLFPGLQPEPIGSNLRELREEVTKGGYHVGIAVDGDADRVTAIDASGRFISSHMVFALLLKHLVEVRGQRGEVVKTVSTTGMIDDLSKRYGLKLHVVPVGFKYICDLMLESDILIGGEESGGTGIGGHIPERDGILVGLLLLEIMATHGKTLGELVDELMEDLGRRYVYLRKDVELTKTQKEALLAELPSLEPRSIGGVGIERIEKIDGMKFYREDGSWLMLRVSGTEAVVRIYAEATSEEEVSKLVGEGEKMVERLPH